MPGLASVFFKAVWCGVGATGFGILFNVPRRALVALACGGCLAGGVKFGVLFLFDGGQMVLAAFLASVVVGAASLPAAHWRHVPPMILAIPSVIPLVPGLYSYRTILGLMKLTGPVGADYPDLLASTAQNAARTVFLVMAIAIGVSIPLQLLRKDSVKHLRLGRTVRDAAAD